MNLGLVAPGQQLKVRRDAFDLVGMYLLDNHGLAVFGRLVQMSLEDFLSESSERQFGRADFPALLAWRDARTREGSADHLMTKADANDPDAREGVVHEQQETHELLIKI